MKLINNLDFFNVINLYFLMVLCVFWLLNSNLKFSTIILNDKLSEDIIKSTEQLVKMEKNGSSSTRDLQLQINAEIWIKDTIKDINNPNYSVNKQEYLVNELIEGITDYHDAGVNVHNLHLYSSINNRKYFNWIQKDVLENTSVLLREEEESNNDNSNSSEGNGSGPNNQGSGSNPGNPGSSNSNTTNPNSSSEYSILDHVLLVLLTLFSNIMDFISEYIDLFKDFF